MAKKEHISSEETKRAMAFSLKRLMVRKPLDKISIREITEGCGVNRQTFYYHFQDIYDLLEWMYQQEAVSLLAQYEGVLLWQDGLLQLLRYLQDNRDICLCALRSLGHEHLRHFFQQNVYDIIRYTVEDLTRDQDLPQGYEELMTRFYVSALAGVVESWLIGELKRTPEELVSFADTMLQTHIRGGELSFPKRKTETHHE